MYYDSIISCLGELGTYQKRKIIILLIACIPHAYQACIPIFDMAEIPFRCAVPGLDNDTYKLQNEAHQRLVSAFIPIDSDTGQFSHCKAYDDGGWDWSDHGRLPDVPFNKTIECERWVYDPAFASESAVSDWDLVCEKKVFKSHINLMVLLGMLVGSLIGGPLADNFGRKKVQFYMMMLQAGFHIGIYFISSLAGYMVFLFIIVVLGMSGYLTVVVIVAEIVGPRMRTFAIMSTMLGWSTGILILPLVTWCLKDWKLCQLVLSIPCLGFVSYWWLVDESPRWLIVKGRLDEAMAIIKVIAKVNKVPLPDDLQSKASLEVTDDGKQVKRQNIWNICSHSVLVVRFLILCFGWCTSALVYYGLTFNMGSLVEGSIYLNFLIQGILEMVGYIVCLLLLNRVSRKNLLCAALLVSGLSCLAMCGPVIAKTDINWINIILFGLGKFGITTSFLLIYIVTVELLPTSIRNSGLGLCSCVGRVASLTSTYIASLGYVMSSEYGAIFPLVVFGTAAIIAGLCALLLPETRNQRLPETIEDSIDFGRSNVTVTDTSVTNGKESHGLTTC